MLIQPYLTFEGRCEEAIEFYKKALGAKVEMMMRMKDNPEPMPGADPAHADKVLHATLTIGDNTVMLSDGMMKEPAAFKGFALSISVADEAEAKKFFNPLLEGGGQVFMPLGRTFWSPCFGMVLDKFGVCWMVGVDGEN